MKRLTEKEDGLLLLDFRSQNWDLWTKFCHNNGYEAKLRGN